MFLHAVLTLLIVKGLDVRTNYYITFFYDCQELLKNKSIFALIFIAMLDLIKR